MSLRPPTVADRREANGGAAAAAGRGEVVGELEAVLRRAGERASAEWERAGQLAAGGNVAAIAAAAVAASDAAKHMVTLCDAVVLAARGEPATAPRGIPPTVPVGRLLEFLRRCLLDELARLEESADLRAAFDLLRAIEDVGTAVEQDVAQRFAERLAGPDGFGLLVEVAHDLRSPLTSILFLAEVLRNGQSGPLTAIQERQLGLIYSAAFGLSAVASDLIELARGGDRLVDLHPMPFSIADCMMSMRDIVLPMAEEKGLEIRLQMPDADFRIGHPAALNRALLNLTTNGLKFTNEGHVEVVGKQLSRTKVEFSVRDTGRGIPPDVMSTLFEPFARRYKASEFTFSSTGLGLSICRKLIAAMGGELGVETEKSVGTRFYFVLDLPLANKL